MKMQNLEDAEPRPAALTQQALSWPKLPGALDASEPWQLSAPWQFYQGKDRILCAIWLRGGTRALPLVCMGRVQVEGADKHSWKHFSST